MNPNLCVIGDVQTNVFTVRNLTKANMWLGSDSLYADSGTNCKFKNAINETTLRQCFANGNKDINSKKGLENTGRHLSSKKTSFRTISYQQFYKI